MRKFILFCLVFFILLMFLANAKKGDVSVSYAYVYLNITNDPPVITSLSLSPSSAYDDSDLFCNASSMDNEGDKVGYYYRWIMNGSVVDFSGPVLSHEMVKPGDVIQCEATPHDFSNGTSASASVYVKPVPSEIKAVKSILSFAGVNKNSAEISQITKQGLISTTGFVVSEVGSGVSGSRISYAMVFLVLIGVLVLVNINLFLRLKRKSG